MFCSLNSKILSVLLSYRISADRFDISTTRRLTNQWNGKLTQSFVWLRQASSLRQFPLISDVRRRREIVPLRDGSIVHFGINGVFQ